MEEEGFHPDIVTYNMLIDRYCKEGRLKDAVYLYNIMFRRGVVPDMITYTALIYGLCKGGNVREAHRLFQLMVHRGLKPDAVSYNTLIYGYCKEGMMQEARSVLFDMIGRGIAPDNFTCWTLVKGYQNLDRMISALNLVLELTRFGVVISRDIGKFVNEALELKVEMVSKEMKPNLVAYRAVIVELCGLSRSMEALFLMQEMVEAGLPIDIEFVVL
ncbi:UNVERIFIED_CONTAM: hypothetical protein Scaly_0543300 [Sesamum calycinum]|uniref:Pentatricopeptide repeat-containing protein n=1 Tax=Sesamum calycinum TaxID=2727403 RepID=A0AAW2RQS7_9LAMI